jgi:hypothetical protein
VERLLALALFVGVVVFLIGFVPTFFSADWSQIETFQMIINTVLTLIIGIEAVRLLSRHSLESVLELLAFIVARKALQPDATSLSLLLDVIAFVILIGGRFLLFCVIPRYKKKTGDNWDGRTERDKIVDGDAHNAT